jgi:polysaccharide export outer membrane protein
MYGVGARRYGEKGVVRFALLSLSILALGGCSTFPDDGPSSRQVAENAHRSGDKHYDLVKLDYRAAQAVAANPPPPMGTLLASSSAAKLDLIEDGDALNVTIFEPNAPSSDSGGKLPSGGTLPRLLVDDTGHVPVPFGGPVEVAGLTPSEAADAIRHSLTGRLISPEVIVSVETSAANSVTIIGEVKTTGLVRLAPNNDTLVNVIAMAGSTARAPSDVIVSVTRQGKTTTAPLSLVLDDPSQNIRLAPRDQIQLIYRPRKYSTFGALVKDMQTPIEDENLSLAGALSKLGGLDTNSANPAEVMLFRFERPEVARALGLSFDPNAVRVPIVYQLNLRDPAGFFVAQRFDIQPDDIIYVPHADLAEAQKFFQLVNEVSGVGYDVAVSASLLK